MQINPSPQAARGVTLPLVNTELPIVIVGGGFGGLAAAYELALAGKKPILFEAEPFLGGLAGSFDADGVRLEKFYHHWFNNDTAAIGLVQELKLEERLLPKDSRTGMYYANRHYRLSKPTDLLFFDPLGWADRFRLGWMTLAARKVNDWRPLEEITAKEWIIGLAGKRVYEVVWEPLLRGKFGKYADEIAAVWFWNKLKLRGSSRHQGSKEQLIYIRGGFSGLVDALADKLRRMGVTIHTNTPVERVLIEPFQARCDAGDLFCRGVQLADGKQISASQVLLTQPHQCLRALAPDIPTKTLDKLESVPSLGNVCVALFLKHSLSKTYWLNVNDPAFPFVAVIEHTNLDEAPEVYHGRHVVYLSSYVAQEDPRLYQSDQEVLAFTLPYLAKMFPAFEHDWVLSAHVWRAQHAQPVVLRNYSRQIVPHKLPVTGLWLSTMSQIYPEDRGTNYAIAYGRKVAREMLTSLAGGKPRERGL